MKRNWNYMYLAKVKMDPRKRKLQEAFTCMRGTFLPLSCLGSTHLTQMHGRCRFTGGTKTIPTTPLTPFDLLLVCLWCACSLSTAIHPGTAWYQSHIPAGKAWCEPCLSCRGCVCTEQAGLGDCWGHRAGALPCLDAELVDAHTAGNKSKAGLSLLHLPGKAFQCDSHLLKLSFCAAHGA